MQNSKILSKNSLISETRLIAERSICENKAALKGNKFINDEGKVIVMNRNFNCDLRQDLLYREYESDDSSDYDDDICNKSSTFSPCKSRINNPKVEIFQSPQSSTFQKNQSIVVSEVKRKKNNANHIMITGKRSPNEKNSNFEKYKYFNCDSNPLMKSEGRKSKILKPIVTKNNLNPSVQLVMTKETSIEMHSIKIDSAINSSESTQTSGGINNSSRMQSENRTVQSRQHRNSLKVKPIKNSKLSLIKEMRSKEDSFKQLKRKTTIESNRLSNLRLSKINQ